MITSVTKYFVTRQVNNLTLQHKSEAIRVEKIHKSEKFTHKRKEMKENHDMYKKIKKEAHENQFAGFELYQRNELADQVKYDYLLWLIESY